MRPCSVTARLLAMAFVFLFASAALAHSDVRTERLQFETDSDSAVIEGSITGYETVDYVLGAREGQSIKVSMETKNLAAYFNLLAPGESNVAMFNGSMGENRLEDILPKSGDDKIRVYMMRSAARRNEVAEYRLDISITAGGDPS